jgi:hypothetical protein
MKTNSLKKISMASVAVLIALLASIMVGCQKEDDMSQQEQINLLDNNSFELEEYIIAIFDFKQSLAIFENKLSNVDFSKLEVTYDTEGRKVKRLPSAMGSIRIEEKIQNVNEKKQALLEKYPEFASFTLDMSKKYFQQCIQRSLNVSSKLLELGINFSRPLLKSGTVENYGGEDWYALMSFLSSWVNSADYVEVCIVAHVDGTYSTWIDDNNTTNKAHITYTQNTGTGAYYFTQGGNTGPVSWVAHTHRNSKNASNADKAAKAENPGLPTSIYCQGGFYDY